MHSRSFQNIFYSPWKCYFFVLFTLDVLLFCIIHPRCVAERCDSSLSVRTGFDVTGFTRNCVTHLQSEQIKKLKNANTQNIKTKLQTITGNCVTLWYEERIISFCNYKVSLKRKAPERKEPQQRTSYQTFVLYANVLVELSQLSHIVIRQFIMTQISESIDDSGSLEMHRISLKSSPEAIFK